MPSKPMTTLNLTGFNERYKSSIYTYSTLDDIPWEDFSRDTNTPVIVQVQSGNRLPLEVLYIPRRSNTLLVVFHGALQQERTEFPYFQFVSSLSPQPDSLLFIFDTTMYLDKSLFSCYLIGTANQNLPLEYTELINALRSKIGITTTTLVGHSSGATSALKVGAGIPDSHTAAVNPMVSDARYVSSATRELRPFAFPSAESDAEMIEQFHDQIITEPWLLDRKPSSKFTWFIHREDFSMVKSHAGKRLIEKLGASPDSGGTVPYGEIIVCDWEYDGSAHAMPEVEGHASILPFLFYVRGEAPLVNLQIQ